MSEKELLEEYSRWLEKQGYVDADWWAEDRAVDSFLRERKAVLDTGRRKDV